MKLELNPRDFHFSTQVRVRWADTDAVGIAYNGAYLTWFEVARVEYIRLYAAWKWNIPLSDPRVQDRLFEADDRVFSLAASTINWRTPAKVDARLDVATRVSRIGRTSFDHAYIITAPADGRVVALGETTQVRVDPVALRPIELDEELTQGFAQFEQVLAQGWRPLS